jgi:hypothetical protein
MNIFHIDLGISQINLKYFIISINQTNDIECTIIADIINKTWSFEFLNFVCRRKKSNITVGW